MKKEEIRTSAAALYDGGWRAEETEEIMKEFSLTAEEAAEISSELAEIELQTMWDEITGFMDDEIREEIHGKIAPCTEKEFLSKYLEKDPDFLGWFGLYRAEEIAQILWG